MFRSKKLALICVLMIAAGLMLSAVGYLLGGRVWGIGLKAAYGSILRISPEGKVIIM